MENRSLELTDAHWGYVEAVLKSVGVDDEYIENIGFHYKTAMIHGYNHGFEDAIK